MLCVPHASKCLDWKSFHTSLGTISSCQILISLRRLLLVLFYVIFHVTVVVGNVAVVAEQVDTAKPLNPLGDDYNPAEHGKMPTDKFGAAFRQDYILYTGGKYENEEVPFFYFEPTNMKPGEKYPLIVWLHGHGRVEFSHKYLGRFNWINGFLKSDPENPTGKRTNFFLLVARTHKGEGWFSGRGVASSDIKTDEPVSMVPEIVDHLLNKHPNIDKTRVSTIGISSGGTAVWELAMRNPGMFSGIAPFSSAGGDISRIENLQGTNVWAYHNEYDQLSDVSLVRETVKACNDAGIPARLTVYDKRGHNSWSQAFLGDEFMEWITTVKHGEVSNELSTWAVMRDAITESNYALAKKIGIVIFLIASSVGVLREVKRQNLLKAPKEG